MSQMPENGPSQGASNAMRAPSIDHAGASAERPAVSRVRPVPSAFMIEMSNPESLCKDVSAIRVPSGDHAASAQSHEDPSNPGVSCAKPLPSALIRHTS